jgi:protein-tyrosine phosphatase
VSEKPAMLFVCLGNICRSPLAEAGFRAEAERIGLAVLVDSAGLGGWHAGEAPDPRARATARRHGIDISGYRARKATKDDFRKFDFIVAMDNDNLAGLLRLQPSDSRAALSLMLDHVAGREGQDIPDPYYGTEADFEAVWDDVTAGAQGLVRELRNA